MTKTPLTLVDASSKSSSLSPPANLGEAGAKLWRAVLAEYRIDDAGGREMLLQICGAADTVDECDKLIARDGKTIRIKGGGLKEHPLIKVQLAARTFIVRSLHRLGLDVVPVHDVVGRPSGTHNPTRF
jgi:Phage terminase, small subunit